MSEVRPGLTAIHEVIRLRKGIQDFLDGNYENPRQHRPGKCSHGQYWYQGCDQCDEAYFTALLSSGVRKSES